jgi:cytochrome P450
VGCFYAAYRFLSFLDLRRRIPPGPFPLPIIGNMHLFRGSKSIQERILEMSNEYGDPMSLWFGNKLGIVLTGRDTIRDALVTQQAITCSRGDSPIVDVLFSGSQDIAVGKYGPVWRIHRKLANRSMRSIIDAEHLEEKVDSSMSDVVKAILEKGDEPVNVNEYVSNVVFNVICGFCYGKSYAMDDPEFARLMYLNRRANEAFNEIMALDFIPGAGYLPEWVMKGISGTVKEVMDLFGEMEGILSDQIKEHRESYTEGEVRDFIDSMIKEQKQLAVEGEERLQLLTERHLSLVVLDFFNAGTDTTSSVLTWFFLFQAVNPKMQERCFNQIDKVLDGRTPTLNDRASLPFVDACIQETLRLRPPAPMGVPHVPISDMKLGRHTVPEGSMVIPNLFAMHTDPKGEFSPNPLEFDPEGHFLDEEGNVKKPLGFLPFGAGRRICLGEQLAKNNLFLIASKLLQKFKFSTIPGQKYDTEPDPSVDALLYAKPYKLNVTPR